MKAWKQTYYQISATHRTGRVSLIQWVTNKILTISQRTITFSSSFSSLSSSSFFLSSHPPFFFLLFLFFFLLLFFFLFTRLGSFPLYTLDFVLVLMAVQNYPVSVSLALSYEKLHIWKVIDLGLRVLQSIIFFPKILYTDCALLRIISPKTRNGKFVATGVPTLIMQ